MSFFWAMGGAAFIYILNARNSRRLEAVFTYPKQNWRMLLFDFVFFAHGRCICLYTDRAGHAT